MGGDRKRNKEARSETERKMLLEKRCGSSEPLISGQLQAVTLLPKHGSPCAAQWRILVSSAIHLPPAARHSKPCLHTLCLPHLHYHRHNLQYAGKKSLIPLAYIHILLDGTVLAQPVLLLVVQAQADTEDIIPIL